MYKSWAVLKDRALCLNQERPNLDQGDYTMSIPAPQQLTWPRFPLFPSPGDFVPIPAGRLVTGLYMLWAGEVLMYIGQSIHVGERIMEHKRAGRIKFDRVTTWPCGRYVERVKVEAILCLLLSPKKNQALRLRKRATGEWVELGCRVPDEEE